MRIVRCVLWAAALSGASVSRAITVDELIAKNVEARGGLAKLRAIETLRLEGTRTRLGGGFEMPFVEIRKRPGAIRSEATMQGLTMIRAYDGKEGWAVQPFRGRKDPEKLPADAAKQLAYDADLDGPLVDYKEKGNQVEYLGTEDVDGTEAHKVQVTRPTGDVEMIYLDPDYFLEIRRLSRYRVRGAETEIETDFGGYERVNGVYFPFSIESGSRGSREKGQKINVNKAEANVTVDDANFHFPGDAAPAAK